MIAALCFDRLQGKSNGHEVSAARFRRRSSLPLAAACVVANGVRETLSQLLGTELVFDVIEPAVPAAHDRAVLFENALVYRVRGRLCDVFIVLRPADALRLAAAAFRETHRAAGGGLSPIENQTLDRLAGALVPLCTPLCGSPSSFAREDCARAQSESVTYFEVRAGVQPRVGIGFALTRDPAEEIGARIGLERLLDVELETRVEFARGALAVPEFVALGEGCTVTLVSRLDDLGTLQIDAVRFARVSCGERDGRAAIAIESLAGEAA